MLGATKRTDRPASRSRQRQIVSGLLLTILVLNLGHLSQHSFKSHQEPLLVQAKFKVSTPVEGSEQPNDPPRPCLVCGCTKHNPAILSSWLILGSPIQTGERVVELHRPFRSQPRSLLDLSRAPP